jgi:hypothetical protein
MTEEAAQRAVLSGLMEASPRMRALITLRAVAEVDERASSLLGVGRPQAVGGLGRAIIDTLRALA